MRYLRLQCLDVKDHVVNLDEEGIMVLTNDISVYRFDLYSFSTVL